LCKTQYGKNWEDYEEGNGENDIVMDLLHFRDDENWLGLIDDYEEYTF
jgi:hypothetical protein